MTQYDFIKGDNAKVKHGHRLKKIKIKKKSETEKKTASNADDYCQVYRDELSSVSFTATVTTHSHKHQRDTSVPHKGNSSGSGPQTTTHSALCHPISAAHSGSFSTKFSHTTPLVHALHWLPVAGVNIFKPVWTGIPTFPLGAARDSSGT